MYDRKLMAVFLRIQRAGMWDPEHKSKHPRNFKEGAIYFHGEGEWDTLPGMACFPISQKEFVRAVFGLPVKIATKEEYPLLLDWEKAKIEEIWDYDLYKDYWIVIFFGRRIGTLPDGVIAVPEPLSEERLKKWLREGLEEIKNDEEIMKILRELETTADEEIIEEILAGEWENEDTGLLISYKREGERWKKVEIKEMPVLESDKEENKNLDHSL